jgi:hypothetical protein
MKKTTRKELEEIIRGRLKFFEDTGCKPASDPVVWAVTDYILALAPHILSGKVQFETEVVDESVKSMPGYGGKR